MPCTRGVTLPIAFYPVLRKNESVLPYPPLRYALADEPGEGNLCDGFSFPLRRRQHYNPLHRAGNETASSGRTVPTSASSGSWQQSV